MATRVETRLDGRCPAEMMDHPAASNVIQDECSLCHMPMMRMKQSRWRRG
jgi:hypothetical protein